jgi:hypothetical protein
MDYFSRLASNHDPPDLIFQVARIAGENHQCLASYQVLCLQALSVSFSVFLNYTIGYCELSSPYRAVEH